MLIDHRTYVIKPGKMQAHIEIYQKYGYQAQVRHLGKPLAYMYAESGELNTIVHIWMYKDAADRATRRAAMQADPDWQVYLQKNAEAGYLLSQKTSLMVPADIDQVMKPA
ncbi:MAG: NIPSNAP family protein [Pseudorhodoplanes sp.]|nr:NIPSNAP family protein [Pseudorhodoplanes sp.]